MVPLLQVSGSSIRLLRILPLGPKNNERSHRITLQHANDKSDIHFEGEVFQFFVQMLQCSVHSISVDASFVRYGWQATIVELMEAAGAKAPLLTAFVCGLAVDARINCVGVSGELSPVL